MKLNIKIVKPITSFKNRNIYCIWKDMKLELNNALKNQVFGKWSFYSSYEIKLIKLLKQKNN